MRKKWPFIATGLLLVILVGLMALFRGGSTEGRTLTTLRKVDDFPLFVMDYYADYGFDRFLQEGLRSDRRSGSGRQDTTAGWACTCFASLSQEGHLLFGRNFDWYVHPALLLFTHPPEGYASVSMVDISYLGFDAQDYEGDKATEPSWSDRRRLLDAPYLPFDGMNEHGLAVGMMAVPYAKASQTNEVTISSLHAIRLLLDYATDVDEAISLLRNYNIDFGDGPPLHYLISDSSGNSAVVEFIDGEMNVLRNRDPWQVATNFVISDTMPEGATSSCSRYNTTYETLEQTEGHVSHQEAMALLHNVSQSGSYPTIWSTVYNMTTGDIQVVMGRKYEQVNTFRLEMKGK